MNWIHRDPFPLWSQSTVLFEYYSYIGGLSKFFCTAVRYKNSLSCNIFIPATERISNDAVSNMALYYLESVYVKLFLKWYITETFIDCFTNGAIFHSCSSSNIRNSAMTCNIRRPWKSMQKHFEARDAFWKIIVYRQHCCIGPLMTHQFPFRCLITAHCLYIEHYTK